MSYFTNKIYCLIFAHDFSPETWLHATRFLGVTPFNFLPATVAKFLELSSTSVMLCATNCIMKILFVCNVAMFQEKLHSVQGFH